MTGQPYTDADLTTAVRAAVHTRYVTQGVAADVAAHYAEQATTDSRDRAEMVAALDALADHGQGLAPVVAHQWSVRYPDGFVDGSRFTEAGARQRATEMGGEVVYRAVGPWAVASE